MNATPLEDVTFVGKTSIQREAKVLDLKKWVLPSKCWSCEGVQLSCHSER